MAQRAKPEAKVIKPSCIFKPRLNLKYLLKYSSIKSPVDPWVTGYINILIGVRYVSLFANVF